MKLVTAVLSWLMFFSITATAQETIWSLGVEDNSSAEFISYSNKEFKLNTQLVQLPGYDGVAHRFDFAVVDNAAIVHPLFPAGISCPGAGNDTYVTKESISWNEPAGGDRILEIKLIDSRSRHFSAGNGAPNENMDIDGTDVPKYGLRVALPGNQVVYQYLPYDLGSYIKAKGPVVIHARFKALAGKNTIVLQETSGQSYGRCYHFDYIRLVKADAAFSNTPALELTPDKGFLYASIYQTGGAGGCNIWAQAFNLIPDKIYSLQVKFIDYFNKEVAATTKELRATADGTLTLSIPCPTTVSGHLRAVGSLCLDGKPLTLQMEQNAITLRLAAVRIIPEPTDEEIERSFIGISGLPTGQCLFDPYLFDLKPEIERYRKYRRILQIHNERIHSLTWNFLEKEPGNFRWAFWDEMLEQEKKERIRVQLTILGTPRSLVEKYWKDRLDDLFQWTFSCPPEMEPWANVCEAIATRYREKIADIELWNEPSEQSIFWYKATADDYFNLVKTGSQAIRKAAPEINIVAESVWARQEDFWQRLYKLGIARYIDYPADHYMVDERLVRVNRFLNISGRGKGLICNEAKCDAVSGSQIDEPKRREAARNLMRNLVHMNASQILRIYNFVITGNTWRLYGLVGPDGTPKYTFAAMKTLLNRTTGAEFYREFDFDKNIEAYSYKYFNPQRARENGGDNILFLFNRHPDKSSLTLYVGKPQVTLVDMMDNASVVTTQDGLLHLDLDRNPLMVVGADLQALDLQSAVTLKNLSYDAIAGEPLNFSTSLTKSNPTVKKATIRLHTDSISPEPLLEVKLLPGEAQTLSLRTRRDLPDAAYTIKAEIELLTAKGVLTIPRTFDIVLTRTRSGVNFFASNTFSENSKDWMRWGDVKREFLHNGPNAAPTVKFVTTGTGGLANAVPLTLVEGQTYHLSVRARGQGILRVMFVKKFADGHTETDHNFLTGNLTENWKDLSQGFTAPPGLQTLVMHFYEYATTGWGELADPFFTRIPQDVPLNRILYNAVAHSSRSLDIDSKVEDWPKEWLMPISSSGIRMDGYGGDSDLSASYASAWRDQTLFFLILVKDDKPIEIENESTPWQYDSVQLDFDPSNRNEKAETCQFSFGSIAGQPVSYRHKIIPSEDIVPSYKIGRNPEGVQVRITRQGDLTLYRIAIDARAISPTFHLAPDTRVGFSLLINDNDGKGRKGWLQWSGGIGDTQDSTLFGSLEVK